MNFINVIDKEHFDVVVVSIIHLFENYILNVLEKEATNGEASFALTATPEEWKKAFLEWVHTERPAHPPLSDEAISRESIYREREDAQL